MRQIPVILFEDELWTNLLPLVYTRSVMQLVCGTTSLLGRVQRLGCRPALWCREALAELVGEDTGLVTNRPAGAGTLLLNGRGLWRDLPVVAPGDHSWLGMVDGAVAAVYIGSELADVFTPEVMLDGEMLAKAVAGLPRRDLSDHVRLFEWHWQLVLANPAALREDWVHFGPGPSVPYPAPPGVHFLDANNIHIGEGTRIKPCVVIDAEDGPVHIGRNVRIMPHAYVQGPAYIGDGSLLQTGAVVREGTTIGPVCKVGGEIEGSIIHGYSNKQHDGFLGHSYLGEWINIAADCINSDLKNTYGTVRVPINGRVVESGELFVGMAVGDHSKIGINVSIPTGAVVGYCSSVFDPSCPKFVPSFQWVEQDNVTPYDVERALIVARKVMTRRKRELTPAGERAFRDALRMAYEIEHREASVSAAVVAFNRAGTSMG